MVVASTEKKKKKKIESLHFEKKLKCIFDKMKLAENLNCPSL